MNRNVSVFWAAAGCFYLGQRSAGSDAWLGFGILVMLVSTTAAIVSALSARKDHS